MNGYKIKFNGLDRLYEHYKIEFNEAAQKSWTQGKAILGEETKKLESNISKKYSRQYAIAVGSATDGLYFALRAAGIGKEHKVFCPVLSYVATAGAIRRIGSKIKFIDTDSNGNIGNFFHEKTPDAIVYVNLYGNIADYDRIQTYCQKNQIILIEDAAQSQGAYHKEIPSGALGDVSVFSFDPMKNMPSFGSGGMVLTDNKNICERVISLRRHALNGKLFNYGYNSVISEDHAAQLNFLLDHYDELQDNRERIARRYYSNLPNKIFIKSNDKNKSSYHKLVMLADNRDHLKEYLTEQGIETKIHYSETLDIINLGSYPMAESITHKAISLPIYPFLQDNEIDYICEKIENFYGI
jgi:UDP-2-acetamido-2-deoxy-ribo-hexuluronate aminotransferase